MRINPASSACHVEQQVIVLLLLLLLKKIDREMTSGAGSRALVHGSTVVCFTAIRSLNGYAR